MDALFFLICDGSPTSLDVYAGMMAVGGWVNCLDRVQVGTGGDSGGSGSGGGGGSKLRLLNRYIIK